ncbi:MAG TPA: SGNH/GDSL hydrolase family protein [Moraxellaceae bacterium]|nr:SGNH/GDSL hydrolase family protein [Moraxellaceae bacterium]
MKTLLVSVLSALLLAACGGGGDAAPQQAQAPQPQPTVLAFGDSTMYGTKTNTTQAQRMTEDLRADGRQIVVEDAAVPGTQLHEMLAGRDGRNQPLAQNLKAHPGTRYVLENFGINEAGHLTSVEVYRASLVEFVATVRAAGMVPVIITPNPIFVPDNEAMMSLFAQLVPVAREVAAAEGAALIDVNKEFAGVTAADLADYVHPSAALYDRIAKFEAAELTRIMGVAQ